MTKRPAPPTSEFDAVAIYTAFMVLFLIYGAYAGLLGGGR